MYAEVFLKEATLAFDKLYTYKVHESLIPVLQVGMPILVPFGRGNRDEEAYVWRILDKLDNADESISYKEITTVKENYQVLHEDQLDLIAQMRIRYSCTYGEAAKLMLPPGAGSTVKERVERTAYVINTEEVLDQLNSGSIRYMKQVHVLEYLITYGESSVSDILASCQVSISTLNTLKKKGWLLFSKREIVLDVKEPSISRTTPPVPTSSQKEALEQLQNAVDGKDQRRIKEYLLKGITGSGKTEVYLQLAAKVLEKGKTAIVLVPEISLTPQMTDRFQARFGKDVAIIHSRLTARERYDQWQSILRQEVRLVVGARSAIFSPLQNIGCIVIDEEQETSYQSEMKPRYHARTIARLRVRDKDAILCLGSATPDVESYYRTTIGKSILLDLPERPGTAVLPKTHIVDMREEHKRGNYSVFSAQLERALEECFNRGEQAILFLNRRGFAGVWLCQDCGQSVICPNCSVAMTYHTSFRDRPDSLQCHYCGLTKMAEPICTHCKTDSMQAIGVGTEQVESLFKEVFPEQTILRMDQDTTVGRGSHQEIIEAFRKKEADVLLGTQMIAKGHDFPQVTVVGILMADQLLLQNDFRAKERAFQLITQAAGRAGRKDLAGEVYVQSYDIDDFALKHALNHDFDSFYHDEILYRQKMMYPPYATMGLVLVSSFDDRLAKDSCHELRQIAIDFSSRSFKEEQISFTPMSRSRLKRLNRRYRWQFTLKSDDAYYLARVFSYLSRIKLDTDVRLSIELDPA